MRFGKSTDMGRLPPRLRRAYYDCRYGQLHLHNAIPAGGGFDELTPVLCLHGSGQTGRVFGAVLPALGDARSVYALDLPGCGESDPAPGVDSVDAGVHMVLDFVDSMRIRSFDLLARAEGCAVASRVAEQRSGAVRRMVLLTDRSTDVRTGQRAAHWSLADADSPGLGARLVEYFDVT
jgi:pimeloyl-ACP methyl ester carboxylesterase